MRRIAPRAFTVTFVAFALLTPAAVAQGLGGLGHRNPPAGGAPGVNDNAPKPDPAPDDNAPRRAPEPDPTPPPAAPEPPAAPPAPPEPAQAPPAPPPAPAPPVPAQPEARPVVPAPAAPGPSDNAPVTRPPAPDAGTNPPRSRRVTTPVGPRPQPRPAQGGDSLYPPPAVIIVAPPVIVTTPPFVPPPAIPAPPAPEPPAPPAAPPPAPGPLPPPLPAAPAPRRWPDGTAPAAFADIERAWAKRDLAPLRRHVREGRLVAVSVDGRYAYSLTAHDFLRLTRDALARLDTRSFRFTRLRRSLNGDVTAFGKHVYRTRQPAVTKTVYVSYTLRRQGGRWDIVGVGSSAKPLPPAPPKTRPSRAPA